MYDRMRKDFGRNAGGMSEAMDEASGITARRLELVRTQAQSSLLGYALNFPMPDLALGCLMKPFTAEEVHRALNLAEDKLRGRETVRPRIPQNLHIYGAAEAVDIAEPGFIPSRPSLRTRIEHWIAGQHH